MEIKRKQKKCKVDGTLFWPTRTTDMFCSPKCAYQYIEERKAAASRPKYKPKPAAEPSIRKKAKLAARIRDHHTCRLWGHLPPELEHDRHKIQLEVHHILFLSEEGPDKIWNLITLCEHCHKQIAHKFKKRFQHELLAIVHGEHWYTLVDSWTGTEPVKKKLDYLSTLQSVL